jgi:hypothetical protein
MKIAWIYPFDPMLGNSSYSRSYTEALREFADVEEFDSAQCVYNKGLLSKINDCDLVHLQYEYNFFSMRGATGFDRVATSVKRPVIVTLHEVYKEFPGVFPRDNLRGQGLVRKLREFVYDRRHPAHTAFRRHLKNRFWAKRIIAHYPFQKLILLEKGIDPAIIAVVEHPISRQMTARSCFEGWNGPSSVLRLGSSGFINANYDYEQLFAALDGVTIPWRFTWIGGTRLPEHEILLAHLREQVARRGWTDRFSVTGWVDEQSLQKELENLDLYLALFSNRSTSSTLMKALSASRIIIARDLPLTRDLNAPEPILHLVGNDSKEVTEGILTLARDVGIRTRTVASVERYTATHSYPLMAKRLIDLYRNVLTVPL